MFAIQDFHLTFTTLVLFLLTTFSIPVNALTSCPGNASLVTDNTGRQFQICPGTDFQAPSINIINNIPSAVACAQLCQSTSGCQKAVYDNTFSICHIKGNPAAVNWVQSNQYTGIYFFQQINDGSLIQSSACPTSETIINNPDGSQTKICSMSDYQVGSINVINSVADVKACATICTRTAGCAKAVYDHIYSICHIKGNPVNPPWVINLKEYDSIQVIPAGFQSTSRATSTGVSSTTIKTSSATSTPKPTTTTTTSKPITTTTTTANTGLPACPTGATTFTLGDGSLYEICPKTDYQGPSTQVLPSVLSDWDCLQACSNNANCVKAVFDPANFVCYLKGSNVFWVTSTSYDSVRFINQTTFQSPPYTGTGSWSAPIKMPVIPVAAYVVPQQPLSNRVLMFSSWGPDDFSGATGMTQFADYNWQTGKVSQRTITNTQHDMFCPGISAMADGRIAITGGENAEATSFYDPNSDSFVRGPNMNIPRGYQSSATLSTGGVFTIGGSFSGGLGGKTGELLDPLGQSWTVLPGASVTPMLTNDAGGLFRTDNHAWLYGWRDGTVFQAGPSMQQHWYDTKNGGNVAAAAIRDSQHDAMCGVNVMYDAVAGKIFSTGGSQDYTDSDAFTVTHITTIGTPFQGSSVQQVTSMSYPRGFANGVVLPDGTILVTGGQRRSLVFTDINSILTPELFNPVTQTWRTLASARIPRNYHSVALLLADGTVFTGGGGMCPTAYGLSDAWCNRASDHPDAEIFTPPYLLNSNGSPAARPVIFYLSSSTSGTGLNVNVGGTLTVDMNDQSINTFALMRMGSSTHSINTDQRRVPLLNAVRSNARWTITLPGDSGVLIPGYYFLFAISSSGVPSIARTIQVHL